MMAISIAESLVEVKDFSPSDIAKRYVAWYKSGQLRGMGKITTVSLRSLAQGVSWVNSGIKEAEGNGPAMRAAPLGLYYRHDLDTVARATSIEAGITHDSNIARQGAIAVALGVAVLARQDYEHDQPRDLVQMILPYLEDTPIKYRLLSASAKARNKYERPWETLANMGTGAHILQTVPAAFFAFLNSRSYKDTIETAIRAGGDTDTTAAIAGALAGTHYGISQVAEYIPGLEAADELRDLEQRLYAPRAPGPLKPLR
jgi:ADP-ribosyl-[dinitrogen reductase] hydrolase